MCLDTKFGWEKRDEEYLACKTCCGKIDDKHTVELKQYLWHQETLEVIKRPEKMKVFYKETIEVASN